MARKNAGYGWIPDLPDQRDLLFAAPPAPVAPLPPSTDLRPGCPPVYDQGQLGSCTANAIAGALQFDEMKQAEADATLLSRLFIYYNEREIEGTVGTDSGAMIRDGIKSVNKLGACPEREWPYVISKFADRPPAACYTDAANHRALQYQRLTRDLGQMKVCLATGYPFVFGFSVYESFETKPVADTGVAQLPAAGERVVGGHAVLAVGYDDSASRFLVRNSWGTSWGVAGYFTMPYEYLGSRKLSSDFWTVRLMS
jgi:C1A family cysteine protease